jgi:hypothetical protein
LGNEKTKTTRQLDPNKVHVTYLNGHEAGEIWFPRRYTLTHSDFTGDLFLSIGDEFNREQTKGIYTRLMRDEVLAETSLTEGKPVVKVYCHVSGGICFGSAEFRNAIFKTELPLAIEAIGFGDRQFFYDDHFNSAKVQVEFRSTNKKYHRIEDWGKLQDYLV